VEVRWWIEPCGLQAQDQLLGGGVLNIEEDDLCFLACEGLDDRLPDAAGAAGDDDDTIREAGIDRVDGRGSFLCGWLARVPGRDASCKVGQGLSLSRRFRCHEDGLVRFWRWSAAKNIALPVVRFHLMRYLFALVEAESTIGATRRDGQLATRTTHRILGIGRSSWREVRHRGIALDEHHALDLVAVQVLDTAAYTNLHVHSRDGHQVAGEHTAIAQFD
jgi:hypothetical protein